MNFLAKYSSFHHNIPLGFFHNISFRSFILHSMCSHCEIYPTFQKCWSAALKCPMELIKASAIFVSAPTPNAIANQNLIDYTAHGAFRMGNVSVVLRRLNHSVLRFLPLNQRKHFFSGLFSRLVLALFSQLLTFLLGDHGGMEQFTRTMLNR